MRIYLDRVRDNLESKIASEKYLIGYMFWVLQKGIAFEDKETPETSNPEYFEGVVQKVSACLAGQSRWSPEAEANAWKACMIRDVSIDTCREWSRLMEEELYMPDMFLDGVPCMLVESLCEKLGVDPNDLNNKISEMKFMFLMVKATSDSLLQQALSFQQLKTRFARKRTGTEFISKRISQEQEKLKVNEYINYADNLRLTMEAYARELEGRSEVLLQKFVGLLDNFSHALQTLCSADFLGEPVATIDLCTERLFQGRPPDVYSSQYKWSQNEIVGKTSVVLKLLYQQSVGQNDIFSRRDTIM